RLGLSPTIVQRLVTSLAGRGYIEKDADTQRYRLGHRALALGASGEGAFDYLAAARRELERLAHEHQLNGFVSVLRSGRATYLRAVQADGRCRSRSAGAAKCRCTAQAPARCCWRRFPTARRARSWATASFPPSRRTPSPIPPC